MQAQAGGQTSTLCYFTAGPIKGDTVDYAPRAGLPVGSGCQDGQGSTGRIVAAKSAAKNPNGGVSTLCYFTAGPIKGDTVDYAPRAGLPVGSGCQDGQGSTGRIVAKPLDSDAPRRLLQ